MRVGTVSGGVLLGVTLGVLLLVTLVWFLWPAKLDPAFWDEPEPPAMTGVLEPRGRLAAAEIFAEGLIADSEGLALGPDGAVYTGTRNGRLLRINPPGPDAQVQTVAEITTVPVLGLAWLADGVLGAAASDGVYAVMVGSGEVRTLATEHEGRRFGFANDLALGPDGTIYFTDSSWKWANAADEPSFQYDMAENRPYGTLYALDPRTGETRILVDDLRYPNGVAMATDGRSVFFLETFRYRLWRYWLEGEQAGVAEIVADNLPGIPDGLRGDGEGRLYIGMDTQRVPLLRFLHRNPFWTRMLTKLPEWVWLRAGPPRGFILVVDEAGDYLDSWHDPDGRFGYIANVVPGPDGSLWIGSLNRPLVGRFSPPSE